MVALGLPDLQGVHDLASEGWSPNDRAILQTPFGALARAIGAGHAGWSHAEVQPACSTKPDRHRHNARSSWPVTAVSLKAPRRWTRPDFIEAEAIRPPPQPPPPRGHPWDGGEPGGGPALHRPHVHRQGPTSSRAARGPGESTVYAEDPDAPVNPRARRTRSFRRPRRHLFGPDARRFQERSGIRNGSGRGLRGRPRSASSRPDTCTFKSRSRKDRWEGDWTKEYQWACPVWEP